MNCVLLHLGKLRGAWVVVGTILESARWCILRCAGIACRILNASDTHCWNSVEHIHVSLQINSGHVGTDMIWWCNKQL